MAVRREEEEYLSLSYKEEKYLSLSYHKIPNYETLIFHSMKRFS